MSESEIVNYWKLEILSCFHWISREESVRLHDTVDPDNEESIKTVLREVLLPYLESTPSWASRKEGLRMHLRYFLTTRRIPEEVLEDVFCAEEPPFSEPDPIWNYYLWAWEVLFPGEDYHLESLDGCVENNDRSCA